MIAAKLLVAMAACIKASPAVSSVPSALEPATTDWKPLPFPTDDINWDNIDMDSFNDPANWNNEKYIDLFENALSAVNTSSNPAKDVIGTMSGPCEQGCFPDYNKAFDALWTWQEHPVPGDPPLTVFWTETFLRIGDCGECFMHKLGSSLGGHSGGCWDFRSCGRDQLICIDPHNHRAHRTWKGYVKTCYELGYVSLGDCGFIVQRAILHPVREVPCTW
ncbi:hypothetical protein B0I35DRAFT_454549 [Stachybotrys elegans]|uniref:Uncharacterized protein n=1 Tax=Stachybotrys elegans TaxID=80388 RepID=A0A8K0WKY9_9HYPO|nr:hypothetical protein B0I35DRAFT_454549 [Stachybotrys elegans]